MSQKITLTCDVCGKTVETEHQKLYMATITIDWTETISDGGVGTEHHSDTYHIHNDFSNCCMSKIWKLLKNKKF